MRHRKDGSVPLQRMAVTYKAKTHRAVARELAVIVESSIKDFPQQPESNADANTLGQLVVNLVERYVKLLETLARSINNHRALDDFCMAAARKIKPGRPPKPAPLPQPTQATGLIASVRPKSKGGRPAKRGKNFDDAVYGEVEDRREELRAQRKSSTIKAALLSLFEEIGRSTDARLSGLESDYYARYRAAYGRGKKRTVGA